MPALPQTHRRPPRASSAPAHCRSRGQAALRSRHYGGWGSGLAGQETASGAAFNNSHSLVLPKPAPQPAGPPCGHELAQEWPPAEDRHARRVESRGEAASGSPCLRRTSKWRPCPCICHLSEGSLGLSRANTLLLLRFGSNISALLSHHVSRPRSCLADGNCFLQALGWSLIHPGKSET